MDMWFGGTDFLLALQHWPIQMSDNLLGFELIWSFQNIIQFDIFASKKWHSILHKDI